MNRTEYFKIFKGKEQVGGISLDIRFITNNKSIVLKKRSVSKITGFKCETNNLQGEKEDVFELSIVQTKSHHNL